jgi:hypothetical protein
MRSHDFSSYSRPGFKLPYREGDYTPPVLPLGPKSVHVTSPYLIGVIDIRWDNPGIYAEHNNLDMLGVNVYRSYDTPEGPYTKLNDTPVGSYYYRDETKEVTVLDEDPMQGGRLVAGTNATGDWIVKTYYKPIVIPGTNGQVTNSPRDVRVDIKPNSSSTFQTIPAFRVFGDAGEIYLIKDKVFNHTTHQIDNPILPDVNLGGEIRVSYNYINNAIQTDINRKIYYKVATVALDPETGDTLETPLGQIDPVSLYDMEKIDWIWAEAIRRNKWLLEQAGERVKLFIRKWAGERCSCWDDQYRQAKIDCPACYGTGYVGGYEGPYDILVAPPETEKVVNLTDIGLHITYDWMTWTGPHPLLNDRDFVIRSNNDRYSIGRVNPQGSRGAIYQQHFTLAPLDQHDVRYRVPIIGGASGVPASHNAFREDPSSDASPAIPNKPEIPDQYERTGRTVTFENIMY